MCVYLSRVLLRLLPPLVVVVQPTGRGRRRIFLAVLKTFEFQFYKRNFFLREMSQLPGGPSCPPPPPRSSNTPAACRPKASRTFAPAWSWTHWCCTCKKVEKRKSQFTIPIWKHLFEMRQFSPFDRHSLQRYWLCGHLRHYVETQIGATSVRQCST